MARCTTSILLVTTLQLIICYLCIHATSLRSPMRQVTKSPHLKVFTSSGHANSRQAVGQCPGQAVVCELTEVCCEGGCCPSILPNCGPADLCVNDDGSTICTNSAGISFLCNPCFAGSEKVVSTCTATSTFNRCPADPNLAIRGVCLTAGGFVPCGAPNPVPGVICDAGGIECCRNPFRCCPDGVGCCTAADGGIGLPEKVASPISFTPGVTPESASTTEEPGNGSSPNPVPSRSQAPSAPPSSVQPSPQVSPTPTNAGPGPAAVDPLPTRSSPPPVENDNVCLPSHATVELLDGSTRTMQDLRTGDYVRVSGGEFSMVFMWTHQDWKYKGNNYVSIEAKNGYEITATIGHIVYVCRRMRNDCKREITEIQNVEVGDGLWVVENGRHIPVAVLNTRFIASQGLFNPQTLHGDIVVNGVISTCYTRAIEPRAAHSMLAPIRAMYRFVQVLVKQASAYPKSPTQ